MNLSKKGPHTDAKLSIPNKATTLNPNAAEFIPFSLRSSLSRTTSSIDSTARGALGKAVVDRTESSISNNSDDEVHQYWRCQLPDDITPDFKFTGEEDSQGLNDLSLAHLSIRGDNEASVFPSSKGSRYILNEHDELSQQLINDNNFADKLRFSNSSYREDLSSTNFLSTSAKPWDMPIGSTNHHASSGQDGLIYDDYSEQGFFNDILVENSVVDDTGLNPLEILASLFPGFAAESIIEVYYANGCDLHLTTEILNQLELQVDGNFNQNLNSKTLSAPDLSAMDFPALTSPDGQTASVRFAVDSVQQSGNPYRSPDKDRLFSKSSSAVPSRGAADFASPVKKLATQDSGIWKYDKNGYGDVAIGSSRSSHVLASGYYGGHGRADFGDRLQSRGSALAAPVWLETGDTVANMYSEMREEASDHARLRNAYFEQAQQAYIIGNKALAKDLSVKGQLHNMHMKAAHGKAEESIYHKRNPVAPDMQGNERGHERMIDLQGLHANEAIHVLKHELSVLRSTARATEQFLQVYICVGTGQHTRGARIPARLPIAVQRFLLEEGHDFTEPQPGLLRIVIY
ncbi:putative Smr domain-containing protein [Lupinus albus]|uniref:Putative Smr domain-containing protein n=1 Tax=Lupinus albus TaxID=3870 RepID=A0A6A4PQ55_LUPAL|nr:putative Smr domain-containing protein [Lupinus albus]